MSYNRVVWCMCVDRQQSGERFCRTQEYLHKHIGGGCDHKLLKSKYSTFAAKILFYNQSKQA